jgi:hypothetical protein
MVQERQLYSNVAMHLCWLCADQRILVCWQSQQLVSWLGEASDCTKLISSVACVSRWC